MLTAIINSALEEYEINKGIYRQLFNFLGFGHAPAIRALRKLNLDKANIFQILECFIINMPKKSQETFKVYNAILSYLGIKQINDADMLTYSLKLLCQSKLLTEKNFNIVKNRISFTDLTRALVKLKEANLLTQEYFDFVECHFPSKFAEFLISLKAINCLTPENFNFVKEHENPVGLTNALSVLMKANLLTPKNFKVVKEHENPVGLTSALIAFDIARLLTSENFVRLIQPQNNILLTLRIGRGNIIWDRIPPHLLTQPVFEELIRRALLENPPAEIERYINNLLLDNVAGFNDRQSTHTASIHDSVSTSATKLWNRYGDELPENKIKQIITTIKKDIANLSDTLIDKAAKNCIERITKDNYIFTDSKSKVTLKQLLALSYLAINDDKARLSSLEDAKEQFIIGLYEIQRGYNLSAEGVDNKQEERPICTAGTFNKLMEKLAGIHPDVELFFITKNIAALKLPVIVREEIKNYLEKFSKPETKEEFHSFIKLLDQLLKDGIDSIWNKIKPKVADRLFDEFKSIYQDNKGNPDFLDLIENGQYVELKDDLSAYQQHITSSAGYRKYCSQILQSHKFFSLEKRDYLSDHLHDNAESQRKYDQKFGLVLKK